MSDVDQPAPFYDDDSDDDLPILGADLPPKRSHYDDEEEEEEEDDEEDEEEEEETHGRARKKAKRRHKRTPLNPYLDTEALVSDDEGDEDEDEEEINDGFIEHANDDFGDSGGGRHMASLNRKLDEDMDEQDLERIAEDIRNRNRPTAARYTGDMNQIPQRLLMPSVHDANLWQVRVKVGKERDIVFSLMRKSIDVEFSAKPLSILSAFQRDSLPGIIYVEARSSQHVLAATNGLIGVFVSRGATLVPIEEMASLLQIKKIEQTVTPGNWVRIRRGKHQNDLAQVVDVTDNGEDVGLKFIPRIDMTPRDESAVDGKKRKKGAVGAAAVRPTQRFFNYEEVVKVYGRKAVAKRNQVYVFQNDTYRDGFIEKDFKISALILDDVNPTLDEITQFTRGQDGMGEDANTVDLSVIAESSRKAAIAVLQPGDHVEVFEGEQSGMHGVVQEVSQDIVTISAIGIDIEGQKMDLPARSVRKRFKPGDHVKVMTGQNADETGLVVAVSENIVTFLSDMSMQEVSVFSKDLREAAEVGAGTNIVGSYELHDLVQLDQQTVGVIFKTERDSFRVMDQNGQTRLVKPQQISMRRDSNRAIAVDSEGHEIRIHDNMKEVDGENRTGRVLHIHQSYFAFLHNREIVANGGVFITRTRSLVSVAPKSNANKLAGVDTTKQNPNLVTPTGGMVGSGAMGRGPRDRLIGVIVSVVKGGNKGLVGTIKDMNGQMARVELNANNKIITIDRTNLKRRLQDGRLVKLDDFIPNGRGPPGFPPTANPYAAAPGGGGSTPRQNIGRTPNPYALGDARTPGWNASSRTPNPYANNDGGRTPGNAWNPSSKTPNPYSSGASDPWSASSRTPNPYAGTGGGWGGTTPGRPSFGGATPGRAGANPGWGGATPGRSAAQANGGWGGSTPGRQPAWGNETPARTTTGGWGASAATNGWQSPAPWGAQSAPTPAAAPTPGFTSAATPADTPYYATPFASAQTPYDATAQTPAFMGNPSANDDNDNVEYDAPDDWLVQPALNHLTDGSHTAQLFINVVVTGTMITNYRDGALERKTGHVISVLNPSQHNISTVEATATVVFDDHTGDPGMTVPVKYLRPIVPMDGYTYSQAVAMDGRRKGSVLRIRDFNEKKCSVSTLQEVYDEVPTLILATLTSA
ncbi:hypothetical protein BDV98DRAFT_522976 [Pterulicium gracile]|uniref:Transcription elongation factor SPT5 n=1 Tax=Pterulicium gracile TaxID=1884261 RepID=A0A5C3QY78_9AGAR|nr:hypothetical protein BDV98DRAFT_522976 [Pterula gracilis]